MDHKTIQENIDACTALLMNLSLGKVKKLCRSLQRRYDKALTDLQFEYVIQYALEFYGQGRDPIFLRSLIQRMRVWSSASPASIAGALLRSAREARERKKIAAKNKKACVPDQNDPLVKQIIRPI